ncbi:MAG TPA: hypothetical protein VFD73_25575, partial [Gemmatimonadales bacterium]|nr:hypothetical protein [Gemmatimonadales bacterium]
SAPPNALGALSMPQLLWHRTSDSLAGHVSRYVRLTAFSFLILIGRFVTLEGMKIRSVTPMHHLMCMGSPATPALGRR